ncbi:MAG: hypothetical protein IPJ34_34440 [Myxococcales bacterium]|nr:hypothetical protein [Myxococcales bacterium]
MFLDRELANTPGSNLFQAFVRGGFGRVSSPFEHRFGVGVGAAHDSKLDGFGVLADAAYTLTHLDSGLYVRTGAWGGTVFAYRMRQEVAQLYVQFGWRFFL